MCVLATYSNDAKLRAIATGVFLFWGSETRDSDYSNQIIKVTRPSMQLEWVAKFIVSLRKSMMKISAP